MIFENCGSLYWYWHDYVRKYADNLLMTEFKPEVIGLHDIGIRICFTTISPVEDLYSDIIASHNGHFSREYLEKSIETMNHKTRTTDMAMTYTYSQENGKIKIEKFYLEILQMGFMSSILCGFATPELFKRKLEITIRHELGHMLDFMRYIDCDEKDYMRERTERDAYDKEYWDWAATHADTTTQEERLRRYYNIPCEARANILGGVNVDELIDIELKMAENVNKKRTVEIKILKEDDENEKIHDKTNKKKGTRVPTD